MLEKTLQEIGLSDKEAKVYLAALELGQASAQEIAKKSKVNRATTYVAIESLTNMGLMSSFHQGKKQFFTAAGPDKLLELLELEKAAIESKKENLGKLMPNLQSIYNKHSEKPVVRYYEGKEGIKTMHNEFIKTAPNMARMVYSVDNARALFSEHELAKFKQDRKENKINNKVIYTYKNDVYGSDETGTRIKIPFDKFPITADIASYDNVVRLINYTDRVGVIIIEDEEIAKSMQALIDLAFEAAKKYNQK